MSIRVSSIEGNGQFLDGGSMFGNAPRAVWEKWISPDEQGRIPLACRALLVEIGSKKILLETGIGSFFDPKMAARFGIQNYGRHILLESLKSLGIDQSEIDFVILSHLHFDHAGGLLPTYEEMEKGKKDIVFTNAKFVVGKNAWKRAVEPHFRDKASFIPGLTELLESSGRLIIVEGKEGFAVDKRITFFESSGHTPGQLHTLVRGENSSVAFAGDLIPGSSWVHLPITMGYDRYPEKLIDEKKEFYETILPKNGWIFFTHDPKWVAAQVQCDEKGKYSPVALQEHWSHFQI